MNVVNHIHHTFYIAQECLKLYYRLGPPLTTQMSSVELVLNRSQGVIPPKCKAASLVFTTAKMKNIQSLIFSPQFDFMVWQAH
jgi:hypothetical protein